MHTVQKPARGASHLLWVAPALYFTLIFCRGQAASWLDSPPPWEGAVEVTSGVVPAPQGYELDRVVEARVTAYEPSRRSCGSFADGRTSTGRNAHQLDGVAVAPEAVPYGYLVYIPGVGYRLVDDTGSAMRRAWVQERVIHLDVRMGSVAEALQFGVRQGVPVHIFRPARAQEPGSPR
jgi:3D (Asp-Asp-Asp) domain-containing protein